MGSWDHADRRMNLRIRYNCGGETLPLCVSWCSVRSVPIRQGLLFTLVSLGSHFFVFFFFFLCPFFTLFLTYHVARVSPTALVHQWLARSSPFLFKTKQDSAGK